MKKQLTVLVAIGMITCLFSSCSNRSSVSSSSNSPSSAQASALVSSITSAVGTTSATSDQEKMIQGTETLIKTDPGNLEIKLPDNWKDRYFYTVFKNNYNVIYYSFYNKANYDENANAGGFLFSIYALKTEDAGCPNGTSLILGQNDQYVFYSGRVTDVEYSENDENKKKDYQEMYDGIQGILKDFLTRNHITAFTDDSATEKINGVDVKIQYYDPRVSKDIQEKANQTAVTFYLDLFKKDWDGIKATSTSDFYTALKNYNASGSSDAGNKLYTANSLIDQTCKTIYSSFYLQKGANTLVCIDASTNCPYHYYEVCLTKDSSGNFIVSGFNAVL